MTPGLLVSKYLPDELVLQILARLPIKSILKFKSVCKLWYKWLSEKYFIQLYNQNSIRHPGMLIQVSYEFSKLKPELFYVDSSAGVSEINVDFIEDKVNIKASSNGLLWCSSISNEGMHYVCNPMTRKYKELPKINKDSFSFYPDAEGKPIFHGLICSSFNNNFHMFLAGYSGPPMDGSNVLNKEELGCLVYDSENNMWSKFNTLPDSFFIHLNVGQELLSVQCAYSNGSAYWLDEGSRYIKKFDLKAYSRGKIALLAEVQNEEGNPAYLLEFNELLSVVQVSDGSFTFWVLIDKHVEKWEMVEKPSSQYIREMIQFIYRISQSNDYLIVATQKKVVVYNRRTKVWSNLFLVKNGCNLQLWFTALSFRSTLYLPYG